MKSLKGKLNEGSKMTDVQYHGKPEPSGFTSITTAIVGSGILFAILLAPTGFGIIGTIFKIIPIWLVILMILVGIFLWRNK